MASVCPAKDNLQKISAAPVRQPVTPQPRATATARVTRTGRACATQGTRGRRVLQVS